MAHFPLFRDSICSIWGLFSPVDTEDDGGSAPEPTAGKKPRLTEHPLERLPEEHGEDAPIIQWDGVCKRFVFITDCRPLAGVVTGTTELEKPALKPIFDRITRMLFDIFERGWRPATDVEDAVMWQ